MDISDILGTSAYRLTNPLNFAALIYMLSLGCFLFGWFFSLKKIRSTCSMLSVQIFGICSETATAQNLSLDTLREKM